MTRNSIPAEIYTDSPLQNPNILLGSFQLMFWLVFRPSAWSNHIKYVDRCLNSGNSFLKANNHTLIQLLYDQRWKKKQVWIFLIQGFIILPLFTCFIGGAVSFSIGTPLSNVVIGVSLGLLLGIILSFYLDLGAGLLLGLWSSISFSLPPGIIGGLVVGLSTSLVLGLMVGLISRNTFDIFTGLVISLAVGLFIGILRVYSQGTLQELFIGLLVTLAIAIGLFVNWWRPAIMTALLIPWNQLLYYIDKSRIGNRSSLLSKNIAFWDEWQYIPIWGLEKHLLLVIDKNPIEGQAALDYLSNTRQRWAAQMAQIELDARQLEHCADAWAIGQSQQILTTSGLLHPADTMFRSFNSVSVDVDVALRQSSVYNQRLALVAVADRLNNLIRELTISSDKYAVRFRPIAQRWQNIIDLHLQDLIKESEERQEINSPYIIGVPVTNRQQLFVGRNDISEKLEKLLLDRRSPPLLLYGQRRTGKTSLLNNLGRLLPTSIIPLFVDLQGSISSAKDHTGFLYSLAKAMINSAQRQRNLKLPPLSYETLATDPFTRFDEWLDTLETALAGNTALLALDEFEVLDRVLNEGRFNENDVLGMLRNLIQHRPTFKVLLAGSHTLDEFQRWSSYLINAQVIHLGYLQEAEARQLIEMPIENFALRYEPPASQRVLDITKGHPFLVQLLCAEIVALKNDQDPSIRRLATLADVEAAIPEALEHGSMFFSDIERNQLDAQSLQVLRYFAQQGEAAIINSADLAAHFTGRAEIAEGISGSIELLLRRELIETKPSGYSIQLELIRRWFI
jgi:hypothetical protein